MKIEHIEAVLNELQEEDQTELTNLKQELERLQTQLPISVKELTAIKKETRRVEFLDDLKRSDMLKFHALFPVIEIPAALILLINIATSGAVLPIQIIEALIATCLVADSIVVSETMYKRIDDETNPFKRFVNVLKKMRKSKRNLIAEEISLMNKEEAKRKEIDEIKTGISNTQDRMQDLRHELAYIDGNLQGVETLKKHYNKTEMEDNTRVVEFVNEVEGRKLVKKPE